MYERVKDFFMVLCHTELESCGLTQECFTKIMADSTMVSNNGPTRYQNCHMHGGNLFGHRVKVINLAVRISFFSSNKGGFKQYPSEFLVYYTDILLPPASSDKFRCHNCFFSSNKWGCKAPSKSFFSLILVF